MQSNSATLQESGTVKKSFRLKTILQRFYAGVYFCRLFSGDYSLKFILCSLFSEVYSLEIILRSLFSGDYIAEFIYQLIKNYL